MWYIIDNVTSNCEIVCPPAWFMFYHYENETHFTYQNLVQLLEVTDCYSTPYLGWFFHYK